jgi:hypothetical protein
MASNPAASSTTTSLLSAPSMPARRRASSLRRTATLWGARPTGTRSGTIGVVSGGSVVFVLANDDPLPMAFESLASAAGYMEAVEVENGLYSTPDDAVELNITTHHDPAGLQHILQRAR